MIRMQPILIRASVTRRLRLLVSQVSSQNRVSSYSTWLNMRSDNIVNALEVLRTCTAYVRHEVKPAGPGFYATGMHARELR